MATTKGWRDCCPLGLPPEGNSKNRDSRALAAPIGRNVLVHDYLGIDLERTWEITQRDLPALKEAIVSLLEETPDLS